MNAILGFSELLHSNLKDDELASYANSISISGKILLELINDFLDLSKIESGKIELSFQSVDIRAMLEEMKTLFLHRINKKNIQFFIEIDPRLPGGIITDEKKLRQILLNLIGNAIKFTDQGYIKVSVKPASSSQGVDILDLIIQVEDTGIGIPENEQEKIFESFTQVKGKAQEEYGGTGLGLAICKKLVELLDGEIFLISEVGKGTTFTVILKNIRITKESNNSTKIQSEPSPAIDTIDFEDATILLVDDALLNRELIKRFLKEYKQLKIIEAENGRIAIEKAKVEQPDCILMDMKMPIMDGYKASRYLKQEPSTASIPIIAVTASVLSQSQEEIQSLCDDYIGKPVNKTQLVEKLSKFLKTQKIT